MPAALGFVPSLMSTMKFRGSRTVTSLLLAFILGVVVPFAVSISTNTEAASTRHVHHVHFPLTYSRVGKGASYWFHVPRGAWIIEERNRPGCARTLAVTGTNGYQVVQFHLQPSTGDYIKYSRDKNQGSWSGWLANLVSGTYRDVGIQVKRHCRWSIRFTRSSSERV